MLKKWQIQIPEISGDYVRNVYLYLPVGYEHDQHKRYPVLYMFDGHNVFLDEDATYGKSWGLKEYLDFTKKQLIVVGIGCNESPDHSRLREYAPYSFDDPHVGYIKGIGKSTMHWLVHILKPQIDKRCRTLRDRNHTYIAGSSMGGLMSLYAVLQFNKFFGRAAALSPSIWTNHSKINELICNCKLNEDTTIYMDYGSNEINFHPGMLSMFTETSSLLLKRGVYLTSRIVPKGDHCEACWEYQVPVFLDVLMYKDYQGRI